MAYTQNQKIKGVGFFHHYTKNFLKPYSRTEPYTTDAMARFCLRPEGCEWLRQPHVATSSLALTINDNPPVLETDLSQLDERKLASFKQNIETMAVLLQQFHKDSLLNPTDAARRYLLLKILNPSAEPSSQLSSCVEVGDALFSIGVNFKVAQTLIIFIIILKYVYFY